MLDEPAPRPSLRSVLGRVGWYVWALLLTALGTVAIVVALDLMRDGPELTTVALLVVGTCVTLGAARAAIITSGRAGHVRRHRRAVSLTPDGLVVRLRQGTEICDVLGGLGLAVLIVVGDVMAFVRDYLLIGAVLVLPAVIAVLVVFDVGRTGRHRRALVVGADRVRVETGDRVVEARWEDIASIVMVRETTRLVRTVSIRHWALRIESTHTSFSAVTRRPIPFAPTAYGCAAVEVADHALPNPGRVLAVLRQLQGCAPEERRALLADPSVVAYLSGAPGAAALTAAAP